MLRLNDETTDHDALHFTIERQWKQDSVQRDFWRNGGWCKFYVPQNRQLDLTGGWPRWDTTPDDIGPLPVAFAQYDRTTGFIVITTPLDTSYKWIVPVYFDRSGTVKTPLIDPANRAALAS